ncbi:MAG: HD domain-containing phosphohydrolase [Opitutales bacterium]
MAEAEPPILVVDDDEIIRIALQETIEHEGFAVVTAGSGPEALEHLQKERFGVIISDQRMAEMMGLEFLSRAKHIQPNASRILITGVLTLKTVIDAVNQGEIFRFLAKPWIREELLATIRNAMQRFELLEANARLQADTLRLNDQLSEANQSLRQRFQELADQKASLDEAHTALENNFQQSLELCHRLVDTFYPLLGKFTRNCVSLVEAMGREAGLSDDAQHVLEVSAWLQNLGLLGVNRETLAKVFRRGEVLSEEERQLMYNHPIYGQALAFFVADLEAVGLTIRAHHERWDGCGYPDGLTGDNIPITARILAVAAAYTESGLPQPEAIEELQELSGKAYEPEAVRLFMKVTQKTHLPRKVREVTFRELRAGMVLASGIHSPSGLLLFPEDKLLTEPVLDKIRQHNMLDAVTERLLVYV